MNRKSMGTILSVVLLFVIVVIAGIYLQSWFVEFQSDFQTNQVLPKGSIEVSGLDNDGNLYVRNSNSVDLSYNQIKVDGVECNIIGNLTHNTITLIDISSCTSGISTGGKEVAIFLPSLREGFTFLGFAADLLEQLIAET